MSAVLQRSQYDLTSDGGAFLQAEARNASLFLLGELHGENEIPALIDTLWPVLWESGYRHVAAEVSPWAAHRLEFGNADGIYGLWTPREARTVSSLKNRADSAVLWGCDIEDVQPQAVLRELAAANPTDDNLQAAVALAGNVYQRRTAAALLERLRAAAVHRDVFVAGQSLRDNLISTFDVEAIRASGSAMRASIERENVMKDLFYRQWLAASRPKVFVRFGRNHLHRGLDRRGVSTLGNFIAELASTEHLRVFNIAAFAAGGKTALTGAPEDADERGDDPAFAYLASIARSANTVFDLRPIREMLHRIPNARRSAAEASLAYWADSYDAIIAYREVTPIRR